MRVVQALLACLLFLPLLDLWMTLFAWLVPGAGRPGPVALVFAAAMAIGMAWWLPRLVRAVRADRRRR